MELLFSTVIALGIGFLVGYLTPGRDKYGSFVAPAVAASVTAAVWVALVWLGWTFDGGWIWVVSLLLGGLAALGVATVLPKRRDKADAELSAKLAKG
ncbi:MAG TPA: hypothetical protein VGP24_14855 [Glaciihabitans sp.]|jgi:hypothetical protein|nr:hypothetical protein [Glaciihabitans sp.]